MGRELMDIWNAGARASADREELRELAEAYRCAPRQYKTGERPPMDIALDAVVEFVASRSFAGLLRTDEIAALRRFDECAQDGEGYDVPKEMMRRLAEIGVVRRCFGAHYEATDFGMRVLATAPRYDGSPE